MAPAMGAAFQPVHVQKLFFIIDRRLADYIGGPKFNFRPYHYGPFDAAVYDELATLAVRGEVEIIQPSQFSMRRFRLTVVGQAHGGQILAAQEPGVRDFLDRVCKFVLGLDFNQLVSAIYENFPGMKGRSVFPP